MLRSRPRGLDPGRLQSDMPISDGNEGRKAIDELCLHPRGPPRPQMRPRAAPKLSPRFAAMVVLTTSRGWPRVVTSKRLRPAPSNKLENLMGFFSSFFSVRGGVMPVVVGDMARRRYWGGGPDQGNRVLRRGGGGRAMLRRMRKYGVGW